MNRSLCFLGNVYTWFYLCKSQRLWSDCTFAQLIRASAICICERTLKVLSISALKHLILLAITENRDINNDNVIKVDTLRIHCEKISPLMCCTFLEPIIKPQNGYFACQPWLINSNHLDWFLSEANIYDCDVLVIKSVFKSSKISSCYIKLKRTLWFIIVNHRCKCPENYGKLVTSV